MVVTIRTHLKTHRGEKVNTGGYHKKQTIWWVCTIRTKRASVCCKELKLINVLPAPPLLAWSKIDQHWSRDLIIWYPWRSGHIGIDHCTERNHDTNIDNGNEDAIIEAEGAWASSVSCRKWNCRFIGSWVVMNKCAWTCSKLFWYDHIFEKERLS